MLEKALRGSKGYYAWVGILLLGIVAGVAAYANQLANGLPPRPSRNSLISIYHSSIYVTIKAALTGCWSRGTPERGLESPILPALAAGFWLVLTCGMPLTVCRKRFAGCECSLHTRDDNRC